MFKFIFFESALQFPLALQAVIITRIREELRQYPNEFLNITLDPIVGFHIFHKSKKIIFSLIVKFFHFNFPQFCPKIIILQKYSLNFPLPVTNRTFTHFAQKLKIPKPGKKSANFFPKIQNLGIILNRQVKP